jgi:DNA-directed RNA polymerase subunit omega
VGSEAGYPDVLVIGPERVVPPGGILIAEFDVLRSKVDSTFHLVHLAAKRAREINGYYAHLGEGLTQYIPPLMAVDSDKPLTIALEEIAAEKIVAVEPSEDIAADPLSFIEMEDAVIEPLSLVVAPDDDTSVDGDPEPA